MKIKLEFFCTKSVCIIDTHILFELNLKNNDSLLACEGGAKIDYLS